MENSWKTVPEIPAIHGKLMEVPGKFMGISQFIENSWKDSCEILGKFMELHGKIP